MIPRVTAAAAPAPPTTLPCEAFEGVFHSGVTDYCTPTDLSTFFDAVGGTHFLPYGHGSSGPGGPGGPGGPCPKGSSHIGPTEMFASMCAAPLG